MVIDLNAGTGTLPDYVKSDSANYVPLPGGSTLTSMLQRSMKMERS